MKLFEGFVPEVKVKPKTKHKAKIVINESTYKYKEKFGVPFIDVSFWGHNEGSGSPCDTEEEAQECVEKLLKQYGEKYSHIEVIDERPKQKKYSFLYGWKEYILNYCKEKNQELEIWFSDKSAPFECEIGVRVKGHNCFFDCVRFRFDKHRKLKTCDGGFLGGTHFVWNNTKEEEENTIKEMLDRIFNRECEKDALSFYKSDYKPKEHKIIDGWIED